MEWFLILIISLAFNCNLSSTGTTTTTPLEFQTDVTGSSSNIPSTTANFNMFPDYPTSTNYFGGPGYDTTTRTPQGPRRSSGRRQLLALDLNMYDRSPNSVASMQETKNTLEYKTANDVLKEIARLDCIRRGTLTDPMCLIILNR
ncbi:hypothetical protein ACJMK2_007805 [Sinanodonta woodiana]|uniref:Uncharacterized protein n=1 Tax=Sinanodonta woodiana TaxID=1069815 RepID=A0ABD3VJM2_SINWO